jgi:hypothetical protein
MSTLPAAANLHIRLLQQQAQAACVALRKLLASTTGYACVELLHDSRAFTRA